MGGVQDQSGFQADGGLQDKKALGGGLWGLLEVDGI